MFPVFLVSVSRLLLHLFYCGLDSYIANKESLFYVFFLKAAKYSLCNVNTMKEKISYTFVQYGHKRVRKCLMIQVSQWFAQSKKESCSYTGVLFLVFQLDVGFPPFLIQFPLVLSRFFFFW